MRWRPERTLNRNLAGLSCRDGCIADQAGAIGNNGVNIDLKTDLATGDSAQGQWSPGDGRAAKHATVGRRTGYIAGVGRNGCGDDNVGGIAVAEVFVKQVKGDSCRLLRLARGCRIY